MELLPFLRQLELAGGGGAVPGIGVALDLQAGLDRALHALGKRGEGVGLALFTRGEILSKLHAPLFDRAQREQTAMLPLGRVALLHREAAFRLPGLCGRPTLASHLEPGVGEEIAGRIGGGCGKGGANPSAEGERKPAGGSAES